MVNTLENRLLNQERMMADMSLRLIITTNRIELFTESGYRKQLQLQMKDWRQFDLDTMTSMVNDSTTQISNKLVVIRVDISIINEKIDTVSRKITHIESNQHSCTPREIKQIKDSETQTEMTKSETSETQTESKKQETTKPKITGEATAVNTKYKPNIERNTPTSIFQQGACYGSLLVTD